MASKYLQLFPIPQQLPHVVRDLTREILRYQPQDIIKFCALYFKAKHNHSEFVWDEAVPRAPQPSDYKKKKESHHADQKIEEKEKTVPNKGLSHEAPDLNKSSLHDPNAHLKKPDAHPDQHKDPVHIEHAAHQQHMNKEIDQGHIKESESVHVHHAVHETHVKIEAESSHIHSSVQEAHIKIEEKNEETS